MSHQYHHNDKLAESIKAIDCVFFPDGGELPDGDGGSHTG